jgi:integrase
MQNHKIEEFLKGRVLTNSNTIRNYKMNITQYFKMLNKDINTYFKDTPKDEEQEKKQLEQYNNDLKKIYMIFEKKGKPDLSRRTFFNSIKQFMVYNNKKLKELDFWDILKIRTKGAEPSNDEAILNNKDIKTILSHGNTLSRCLYLMLASSGRRISEVLALTPEDVDTSVSPTTINIKKGLNSKNTKTKMKTICYISDEATESYKAWMKERDEYLKNSAKKLLTYENKLDDPRVFPMSYSNAIVIWQRLLMKANLVETYNVRNRWNGTMDKRIKKKHHRERLYYHPHCLRKFFRSYLGDADFSEYLMGHATLMTKTYRQMKPEDKAEKYKKLMENVTIFSTGPNSERLNDMQKQLTEKDKQISEMQKDMDEMKYQILQLQVEKQVQNGKSLEDLIKKFLEEKK